VKNRHNCCIAFATYPKPAALPLALRLGLEHSAYGFDLKIIAA
jgi:hypothetical protein